MTFVDVLILVILAGFILAGFWFGLIHMVGAIIGLFLGVFLAGRYYAALAALIAPFFGGNGNLASTLAFIFLFLLITKVCGLLLHLVDKIFKIVAIIPFTKTINRLLGAAFGLVEGTLALGIAVYFVSRFPWSAAAGFALRDSQLAGPLHVIGRLLSPLLPEAVRLLQSVL